MWTITNIENYILLVCNFHIQSTCLQTWMNIIYAFSTSCFHGKSTICLPSFWHVVGAHILGQRSNNVVGSWFPSRGHFLWVCQIFHYTHLWCAAVSQSAFWGCQSWTHWGIQHLPPGQSVLDSVPFQEHCIHLKFFIPSCYKISFHINVLWINYFPLALNIWSLSQLRCQSL